MEVNLHGYHLCNSLGNSPLRALSHQTKTSPRQPVTNMDDIVITLIGQIVSSIS